MGDTTEQVWVLTPTEVMDAARRVVEAHCNSLDGLPQLLDELSNVLAAAGAPPEPAVAVKIVGGCVQGTVSNLACNVVVLDYDVESTPAGEYVMVPEADFMPDGRYRPGDSKVAVAYEESPLVDRAYMADLVLRADVLGDPARVLPGEDGAYLLEDRDGTVIVRCPVIHSTEGLSLGDPIEFSEEDTPTYQARLLLGDGNEFVVDGGWHRDMEDAGTLEAALAAVSQGSSPEEAADLVRGRMARP